MESARLRAGRAPPGARRRMGARQPGGRQSALSTAALDEVARGFNAIWDSWDVFQFEEQEIRDLEDSVLWLGVVHMRGSTSRSSSTRSSPTCSCSRATGSCACRASARGKRPSTPRAPPRRARRSPRGCRAGPSCRVLAAGVSSPRSSASRYSTSSSSRRSVVSRSCGAPVAGHDRLGGLHQRRQARERRPVVGERATLGDPGDLHVRQVVADHQQAVRRDRRSPSRRSCAPRRAAAPARGRRSPARPAPAAPAPARAPAAPAGPRRTRRRTCAARAGPRPARGDALHRALAQPQRHARERQPPQQVVEVRVGGEQPVRLEARPAEQAGQRLQLVREVGRVDQHRLVAGPQRDRVGLPEAARHDQRVRC